MKLKRGIDQWGKTLDNKVVAITGASSGIGKSIALECAKNGATLILMSRSIEKLNSVAKVVQSLSQAPVYVYATDVRKVDQIDMTVDRIKHIVGRVDYLVNAAGFGIFEDFMHMDINTCEDMFQTNVIGLMYLTRLLAGMMIDQRNGQVINFGSLAGKVPTVKSAVYSATKAAVIQFSNVLRLELKPFNVKVLTVNCGPVKTNFFNIADKSGNYLSNVDRFMLNSDYVAKRVVKLFGCSVRELNLPFSLAALARLYQLCPTLGDWASIKFASKK